MTLATPPEVSQRRTGPRWLAKDPSGKGVRVVRHRPPDEQLYAPGPFIDDSNAIAYWKEERRRRAFERIANAVLGFTTVVLVYVVWSAL